MGCKINNLDSMFIHELTNASDYFLLITHSTLCSYMFRQFIAIFRELFCTSQDIYLLGYGVGKICAIDEYGLLSVCVVYGQLSCNVT
jgi:hypothetical protein